MKTKAFGIRGFKAADQAAGEFEAIVAVFGNVDRGGDRIVKGAFSKSLENWQARSRPIPVIFSHEWQNLDAHIGKVLEAKETDEGLWVKCQLRMQDPTAAKVYDLMAEGTLAEFSFAYDTIREKQQNGANELLELEILEVGPTLVGMNPATRLLGVKSVATAAAEKPSTGAKQAVAGSHEQRRERLAAAVRARYATSDDVWVWVYATFDETAVVLVENDADGTVSYREVQYAFSAAGEVELGADREVDLQTVIVGKSWKPGKKEGRRNSDADMKRIQGAHDALVELGAKCATSEETSDPSKGAKPQAKSEEPAGAKGEEPMVRSPLAARLAIELLEAGVGDS
jgi:HK97 family phage prohead protease